MTRSARGAPIAAGLIAFAIYLRTLLPGMAFGDWGEMQTVPHVLGIAHPTGYPTYLIAAWVGQLVPIGTVAFRANALSAVAVSMAVAVVVMVGLRLEVRPLIAFGAALCLAVVTTVWDAATAAEVNGLHLLFVAVLLHRALIWSQRRRPGDLVVGGLLTGLAIGNHLLILFVAPFVGMFVVWTGRHALIQRPGILLAGVGAVVLGLSVYLYIPIAASRSPALSYNHPVTIEAVWWLISGAQFRDQFDFLSAAGPVDFVRSLPTLWSLVVERATIVVPILGLVGLVLLLRRHPAFGLTLMVILIEGVYLWASYLQLEHYLLAMWLVLAVGLMTALDRAADLVVRIAGSLGARNGWRAATRGGPRASRLPNWLAVPSGGLVAGIAAAIFAAGLATTHWSAADRSQDRSAEAFVAAVWTALPPNAVILSEWDVSTPLWHSQIVLGARPDVLIVDDSNVVYEGWGSREDRIASLICDRPVFILRLHETDLGRTRDFYHVAEVTTVRIASGGPTAVFSRPLDRVLSLDERRCSR